MRIRPFPRSVLTKLLPHRPLAARPHGLPVVLLLRE
jgi:hypothetical protein